ncbi:MAG: RodZ domain-containing protein [Candidatus Solibacter sp.]
MTPVGEMLRRERLKRNLDLEEISRELKISARFLQAIENDQYEKLPGGVFAKSFVRQYARLLGLDEEQIAGQVQQSIAPVPEISQLPERPKPAGFAPIEVPKVDDEWQTVGDRSFRWSGWLSAVVFVAVMLVCSVIYTWFQHPNTSWLPHFSSSNPPQQTAPAQSSAVQSAPATPQPVQPEPAPVATQPAPEPAGTQPQLPPAGSPVVSLPAPGQIAEAKPPSPKSEPRPPDTPPSDAKPLDAKPLDRKTPESPASAVPPGSGAVRVAITADEAVWVLARADGKYAFSATLDPHSTRTVEAAREVTLRLGNAGGVSISLNGKPLGPVGPKGQVRTLQFTSGGFQIVPAKPPSAPLPDAARF